MILDAKGKPFLTDEELKELFRKELEREADRVRDRRFMAMASFCFDANVLRSWR